jgi:hypothetical protein
MAGHHVVRTEHERLERGGVPAEMVPAHEQRAAAGEDRDTGLRGALPAVAVFVHQEPPETALLDSSSVPPGPSEDISELADVDGRQRCHPAYGRDGAIPQIGERLSISRRTVQTHVGHIFMKPDVSSRAQLAAEVTRQPSRG